MGILWPATLGAVIWWVSFHLLVVLYVLIVVGLAALLQINRLFSDENWCITLSL